MHLDPPLYTLKPVAEDVWVADGGFVSFYGVPFPTRMTAIRLPDGGLLLHSPIGREPGLLAELEALGPVRHLVAPNWIHYALLPGWQAAEPEAVTWACPGAAERAASRGVEIGVDRVLEAGRPEAWGGALEALPIPGSRLHREVAFFHHPSRTLVLTDLIENFVPDRLPLHLRVLARAIGVLDPDGRAPVDIRLSFVGGRAALGAAVERMIAWDPERVIFAHGRWYPRRGADELRRAFRWVLGRA